MEKSERENELVSLAGETAACGFPSPAEPYLDSQLDLNRLLVKRPAATFFVRAAGDSMVGAGIFPGDILVVDRSLEARDGDVVIACIDGEFTVKYLRRGLGGEVFLEPANRKYKTLFFKGEEEFRLFGVVTSSLRLFRDPVKREEK